MQSSRVYTCSLILGGGTKQLLHTRTPLAREISMSRCLAMVTPNWLELPIDQIEEILSCLDLFDVMNFSSACKTWDEARKNLRLDALKSGRTHDPCFHMCIIFLSYVPNDRCFIIHFNTQYLSHPKISILGCEYILKYNYAFFEYFEKFSEFSSIYSHFFLELNPIDGKF